MIKQTFRTLALLFIIQTVTAQNFIKDSLDIYIKREMVRWNLPGLAIAVVKDGKVVHIKGYGYSDITKKTPVTENTEFQIASNSKAFTGTSLALLEHYGRLKLDDKVKKYLPYFKMHNEYLTENITIRDVLSHRIGYETFQSDLLNWASTRTRKELVENMANVTPKFGFREKYGYCNMGFVTAGEIIPAVCDTTWDDFLKAHYFTPLGMTRTETKYENFIHAPNASKAYTLLDGKLFEIPPSKVDNIGAAGSITSNVNDLSKWVMMQLDNGKYNGKQIVPAKVIHETRVSNTIVNGRSRKGQNFSTYGLGWFMEDAFGKKIVEHDGGANGFLSKTVLIPEENLGYVILTNSDGQYFYDALSKQIIGDLNKQPYQNLSALYYQGFKENYEEEQASIQKLKSEADAYKATPDAYKKIAGIYTNKVYGKIAIESKEDFAEVSFEFHPQYKGKMRFKSADKIVVEYGDDTSLGTKELKYDEKGTTSTIEIKVNDFIDQDTYIFTKINSVFKPFGVK
ncbi:MAG: serine hydrolase [Bacteroidetes bacterium]|jgi:CubicO group peptidase (beta-lactamase class C family)|nr:serine hydrolase [Bacteroidota bacterium]